jgi:DNA repair protein RadC
MTLPSSQASQPADFDPAAPCATGSSTFAETSGLMRFDLIEADRTPRVRDRARRYGVDTLLDAEVLELHLARSGCSMAGVVADKLIARFGGLAGVLAADAGELGRDLSQDAILDLKLMRQVAQRLSYARLAQRELLTSTSLVQDFLRIQMGGLPREEFWVLFLDRTNHLIVAERQSVGTVDHAPVYPREVLRRALEVGASALILAHNHPSGDPTPSRPDLDMTRLLSDGAKALGLKVWDHMIVGADKVLSLRGQGLM